MGEDGLIILVIFTVFLIVSTVLFHGFSTMDYRIVNGDKILIGNAVYKCEAVAQRLDLK